MILSEDDAATRWCPFARAMGRTGATPTRPEEWKNQYHCIGSWCMLWQWTDAGQTTGLCGLSGATTLEPQPVDRGRPPGLRPKPDNS